MNNPSHTSQARWIVRGDIDGFFGLALDNLVQLLVIGALCTHVLGFNAELVYGRILPGAAVSVLLGNLFYSVQAMRLARRDGLDAVTALPYGINTVSLFAYVLLVMLPVKLAAQAAGIAPEEAARMAWRAGLVACLGSALIEIAGSAVAGWIRRHTPRAALLSSLAGIAVSFISLSFLFRAFAAPVVGLVTFVIVLVSYFGGVRFRGGFPGGFVTVAVGVVLAWALGLVSADPEAWSTAHSMIALHPPRLALGDLLAALQSKNVLAHISIVVPMGVVNVVGSLQNIESAEAAGDSYATPSSLLANGIGTLAAACFGSCFPTTIYIGHPGWKRLGARIGYSLLNGVFVTGVCLTGTVALIALAVPIEAGLAIVLWIGVVIVAQAFEAVPTRHIAAVAVGILPGIAAWGAFMLKQGLRAAGMGGPAGPPFSPALETSINALDIAARGLFALEQGFLFTAMILAAITVEIIDRRFARAAAWCLVGAALAWIGLIHAYAWNGGDTVAALGWGSGASWSAAYLCAGAFLLAVPFLTKLEE
jgi:AGZA family xanthine/uracil permease-like MFS transporter